jgi:hypothetical protein
METLYVIVGKALRAFSWPSPRPVESGTVKPFPLFRVDYLSIRCECGSHLFAGVTPDGQDGQAEMVRRQEADAEHTRALATEAARAADRDAYAARFRVGGGSA